MMKRLRFVVIISLTMLLVMVVACCSKHKTEQIKKVNEDLKARIDSAKMLAYTDKTYNVTVSYPDFFQDSDTTENGTARFNYPDNIKKEISLVMFVEPNVDGWNVKEAVKHLSDSLNHCVKEGDNYFIMSGQLKGNSQALFLEKCFLIDNHWVDYTLYYYPRHKKAIGRLADLLMVWEPTVKR